MQRLIDDIMDLARGRRLDGLPINRLADVDLEVLINDVVAAYRTSEPNRSIETSLYLSSGVSCDPQRVTQLVSNILKNALAYGAPQAPVRVFAGSNEQGLEVWVSNEGDPIPQEVRERLFEPFYRTPATEHREGPGMGLYMAQQIARAHDGTLSYTSTSQETRFTFRMPPPRSTREVRHQCMIYQGSPAGHLPGLVRLVVRKLAANLRVVYFNSPPMVAGLRSYLAAAGLDVAAVIGHGSLVLSSDVSHLTAGRFDPDRMLQLLDEAVADALADGYAGLWAAGDMTWEFGPEKNYDKLEYYEQKLEELFQRRPELQGICQYHADTLPQTVVADGLRQHRACYINETLSRLNDHYGDPVDVRHVGAMLAVPVEQNPVQI